MTEAERAANGATYLDEHVPGWAQRVTPGTIDVHCEQGCPIGQTFGHFYRGAYEFGLVDEDCIAYDDERVERLGFVLREERHTDEWREERKALNAAWEQEVAVRRLRETSPRLARAVERAYAKATR